MGKHSQAHSVPLSFPSSLNFLFFLCFLQNTLFQVCAHTLLIGAPTLAKALVGYGTCTPFPPTSHSFLPGKTVSSCSPPSSLILLCRVLPCVPGWPRTLDPPCLNHLSSGIKGMCLLLNHLLWHFSSFRNNMPIGSEQDVK